LDHPNIVKVYEFYEDDQNLYIITELIEGGELFDEIIQKQHFSERDASICMKALLSSISYCHSHNIMHCDLKPENLLLESNKAFD
jgi:calcium-dependent protein kinase